jgi:2-dehydropantoate 2-reductase
MRVLAVGAGAIGGYFGGRLLAAGRDVTFLVRPRRAALLAQNGLLVVSRHGDLKLAAPPTVTEEALREPFDLVLLSCKAYDLDAAIKSFAPAVGPNTAILPLLNGMRHIEVLEGRFGGERVLGGTCFISTVLDREGRIVHLNEAHSLSFGERDGSRSKRAEAIMQTLSGANFDARLSDAILQEMWDKWVFLATLAGITCLMRASIGDIVAAGASDLAEDLLAECTSVAREQGFPPSGASLQRSRATLTAAGSGLTASMLRDVESGARTEADHIIGDLLHRRGHPAPDALLGIAYAHLKAYEARRLREAGSGAA